MEEYRTYKDNFRNLILDMIQEDLANYVSQRGAKKFFEANVDKAKHRKYTTRDGNNCIILNKKNNLLSISPLIARPI